MELLVDGVFFQFARTGIARVWSSILPRLAKYHDLEVTLLDRGGCPSIAGIEVVQFPSYTWSNTAADSFLIDQLCVDLSADVFTSTYYTTPVGVPSVIMIYDMIPEVLGLDLSNRGWQEKQIAISFASYYACISESTRSDLMRVYPSIGEDRSVVTHCGVEREIFRPRGREDVEQFRREFGISNSYYVVVGSSEQQEGYKNVSFLFRALRQLRDAEVDILCVGGEPEVQRDSLDGLPVNVSARRIDLTDEELACAYAGAAALVYPSLYEGFGMPVIEAMACGCPVITTRRGSLGEVAGDAVVFISGLDEDELLQAMAAVREPARRNRLIESGLRQAARYNWDVMAREFHTLLKKALNERESSAMREFFREWKRLRAIQAEVDVG